MGRIIKMILGFIEVICGGQHGDESKGLEVQRNSKDADFVFRVGGGNNAGHTAAVYPDGPDGKLVGMALHLVPSSVTWGKRVGIGAGVVVDPLALIYEILYIQSFGFKPVPNLTLDVRCGTVMIYNLVMDMVNEIVRGRTTGKKIGTTASGMGPSHADLASRDGIRVYDLLDLERFERLLEFKLNQTVEIAKSRGITGKDWHGIFEALTENNKKRHKVILKAGLIAEDDLDYTHFLKKDSLGRRNRQIVGFDVDAVLARYTEAIEIIQQWGIAGDVSELIKQGTREGWKMIAEISQGGRIDGLLGDGIYVTPGRTIAGAAPSGAGFGPTLISGVRLVLKAVPSRVGGGPFPTKLPEDHPLVGEMQGDGTKIDDECGASTGRPRDLGHLDAVIGRDSIWKNGATTVTLSKLDKVCPGLTKIATAWIIKGERYTSVPANPLLIEDESLEVEYVECPSWDEDISGIQNWDDLPPNAQEFVLTFEKMLNEDSPHKVVIDRIGTGPGLNDVIVRSC